MSSDAVTTRIDRPARPKRPRREVIYRHAFLVRLTHWINAAAIFLMVGTGLNIFNAHPRLYWGQAGTNGDIPFIAVFARATAHGARGMLAVGPLRLETTGFLGWSRQHGQWTTRAWPEWLTIPSFTDLADARRWHFAVAWILVVNGLGYLAWTVLSRHLSRDLWPTWKDLKSLPRSVWDHVKLKHPTGEQAKRYNVLQKLAYLAVILMVAGMVATGLAMSPGFDAFAPWLVGLFGGRQSARTLHFLFATGIVAFIVVHLVEVVLAGPLNEVWSMISGRYAVPPDHPPRKPARKKDR
jgi:thiosulfate reductase cytochrome b subunit